MTPLRLIPLFGDKEHGLMILSNRKWPTEPGWCGHGRRTWVLPTVKNPKLGHRVHGKVESWGVMVEPKPCSSKVRLRRNPQRSENTQQAER